MTFEELEWERPVYSEQAIVQFKKYADRLYWWNGSINDWQDADFDITSDVRFTYVDED